jgi:nitric oxide dioxygenase
MTIEQVTFIRQSWKRILPIAETAGNLFYQKLFTAAPAIRHLFKPDISAQANKLMQVLGYVVTKLDRMEELLPEVQKLAARHNQYGAEPAHYEVVGECLVATLKDGLGVYWNAEVQDAWVTAFNAIKNVMIVAQDEAGKKEILQ